VPERWTAVVLRFRLAVIAAWVAVLAGGVVATARLPPLLSNSFTVPGTDSDRARLLLERRFGERPDGTFVVVFRGRHANAAALRRRVARAARAVPTAHVAVLRTDGGVVWAEVATTLDLAHAKAYTPALRRALAGSPHALVTGQPAIQHDLDPIFASDLRRGEAVALPVAFAVLVAVLGWSLAIAVPFVFATCTISATLLAVYALAHALSMVSYVTNLVELIGLGLAIDYSLLVVHRFREELARGGAVDDAVARTMASAGRAVVFSGVTVAIGLGLLLFMPVPFIRSMGVAGFLIPLASVAAAVTLQPVLLSLLGRRAGRPRTLDGGFWTRLAGAIMRRPLTFLAAGATLLLAAAAPVAWLHLSPGSLASLPQSTESARGLSLLRTHVGNGVVTPTQVVVSRAHAARPAIARLADELFHDPEVYAVASGRHPPFVDRGGTTARIVVVGRHEYGDPRSQRLVRRLRAKLAPAARFPPGANPVAGGPPPQGVDFLDRSYAAFPWIVAAAVVLTYLLLLRAFRSLLLPLKAVILNALSVAAVYGILVVVFGGDPVDGWIPIFLFATLFGLSMDYEVFLVTRMREAWDETHDNRVAVARGLERTGRVVTAAAAIMIVAFGGFVVGRVPGLQQFGVGLALGVLLDATIVRALLVPSLMAVFGRWNWWLPVRIARLVRAREA
jgi:uncharacterized membrane protein YdfJ with MMPL/SSD domain